jgi:hypothetical protein
MGLVENRDMNRKQPHQIKLWILIGLFALASLAACGPGVAWAG